MNIALFTLIDYKNDVEELNLTRNEITNEGCKHISELIEAKHTELKLLNLSMNKKITFEGLIHCIEAANKDKILSSLKFNDCSISIENDD